MSLPTAAAHLDRSLRVLSLIHTLAHAFYV